MVKAAILLCSLAVMGLVTESRVAAQASAKTAERFMRQVEGDLALLRRIPVSTDNWQSWPIVDASVDCDKLKVLYRTNSQNPNAHWSADIPLYLISIERITSIPDNIRIKPVDPRNVIFNCMGGGACIKSVSIERNDSIENEYTLRDDKMRFVAPEDKIDMIIEHVRLLQRACQLTR